MIFYEDDITFKMVAAKLKALNPCGKRASIFRLGKSLRPAGFAPIRVIK
jgi:hypothetical protein